MREKILIENELYVGERPLFGLKNADIKNTIFGEGESPLKHASDITVRDCGFKWKYPIWYADNVDVKNTAWFFMARAGVWYCSNIKIDSCVIEAPKNFRRCNGLTVKNTNLADAAETLWNCDGVDIDNVQAKGDYFAMNSRNINVNNLTLCGNYSFDGGENIEMHNSKLLSKDAFWNCKNVTVYDSYISGEYIGWNSENLTFINCTIESLQGFCYINNLKLENCRLPNTTLAFEYSTVNADIKGDIESVFNPRSGSIKADKINKLIIEKDKVDPQKTNIIAV